MATDKTELEWPYSPTGYLEAPYRTTVCDAELQFDSGMATATLHTPQDPVPDALRECLKKAVETVLIIRQLTLNRPFQLEGPRITQQRPDGKKATAIGLDARVHVSAEPPDMVATDRDGNVVVDTRAERIAAQKTLSDLMVKKVATDPLLPRLLASYRAAIDDPKNEFVHLYEVRDALMEHYGRDELARKTLGISKKDWSRLGQLANKPVFEGRHRGRQLANPRHASASELEEARSIAKSMIEAYRKIAS